VCLQPTKPRFVPDVVKLIPAECSTLVFPTYNSIQQGNGGCKYCSKKFVDAKEAEELMLVKV
jgi:hypothetical protein